MRRLFARSCKTTKPWAAALLAVSVLLVCLVGPAMMMQDTAEAEFPAAASEEQQAVCVSFFLRREVCGLFGLFAVSLCCITLFFYHEGCQGEY